jgi:delta24-sterol reductase
MDEHNERVRAISQRVRQLSANQVPFRIYHGATNSTRILKKDVDKVVDTSALNHVITIDGQNMTTVVEANVAMDVLVDVLLPCGLIPKIIPEFPGITVGGSFSGTACESSSFREGFFDRTVNWMEIILADGQIVKASPTERKDLFYGAAGALGTLGVVTLLELRLMKATRFVELTYMPTTSMKDTLHQLDEAGKNENTIFLDAILFSKDSGMVMKGRLPNDNGTTKSPICFSRASDPWFYLHAHSKLGHQYKRATDCLTCSFLSAKQRNETQPPLMELIPLKDYLFRYDRGAFWMGAYGWGPIPLPFNKFGRRLLDSLFRTRTMYSIMHHSHQSQRFVVQDLAIPRESAETFLDFLAAQIRIWPIWLCPIGTGTEVPLHSSRRHASTAKQDCQIMNIGLWGIPHKANGRPSYYGSRNFHSFIGLNRLVEARVRESGGLKWLYAHNYATEGEFWGDYDKLEYDELRKKWKAETLPDLWDKVGKMEHVWVPTNILRGFWKGWLGKDYLLS